MSPNEILKLAATQLRNLSGQVQKLTKELEYYKKKEHAEKLAMDMANKGLLPSTEIPKQVDEWVKNEVNFPVIEEAIKIAEKLPDPIFGNVIPRNDGASLDPETAVINTLLSWR